MTLPWRRGAGRSSRGELSVFAYCREVRDKRLRAAADMMRHFMKGEKPRPLQRSLRPFRQIIRSINQTPKTGLDLERRGGRKPRGVVARILQRLLALTSAIRHNETTNRPRPTGSLTVCDH